MFQLLVISRHGILSICLFKLIHFLYGNFENTIPKGAALINWINLRNCFMDKNYKNQVKYNKKSWKNYLSYNFKIYKIQSKLSKNRSEKPESNIK